MRFHAVTQSRLGEGCLKVVEGCAGFVEVGIRFRGRVVRIDADDLAKVEGSGDGGDPDGGFAFETANLDIHATGWSGGGQHAESAKFAIADVAFHVACFAPGGVGYCVES